MSLINPLVKRRQFLLGAVGSTCALSCKKLAAFAVANGAIATGSPAAMEAQVASAVAAATLKKAAALFNGRAAASTEAYA